jgi:KDO2-lipid IV(A) lauroyltransferase
MFLNSLDIFKLPLSLSLSKFLQMRLNSFIFRFLPFSVSRCYLIVLGSIYYFLNRNEKSLILKTIHLVFKRTLPAPMLNRKIKGIFKGIIDHYHEKLFVGYSNFPNLLKFLKSQVRFAGQEHLQAAIEHGKGVILVTGHFGAVEFLPGVLALNGYPTSMICRFQTTRLRESMGRRAEAVGLQLIDADKGNIILAAMNALKQGRILITECDEFDEWRPDANRDSYFLNCHLPSDRTLELLHKRSGAQVVTALMQRHGKKQYTCNLTTVGNGNAPVNISIHEQCLGVLEKTLENYPEQWYQWKKFGKMIKSQFAVDFEAKKAGLLGPEIRLPLLNQA